MCCGCADAQTLPYGVPRLSVRFEYRSAMPTLSPPSLPGHGVCGVARPPHFPHLPNRTKRPFATTAHPFRPHPRIQCHNNTFSRTCADCPCTPLLYATASHL
eukprot:349822-Chlamydomonas_euryale.AAC.2